MLCDVFLSSSFREKIYAACRKSQPTSTVCLFSELSLIAVGSVDYYSSGEGAYNLQSLCDLEGVAYGKFDRGSIVDDPQRVEEIGKAYIDEILSSLPDNLTKDITTVFDEEIKAFKILTSSVYSNRQKPDVGLLAFGWYLILLIEIHSCSSASSFKNTLER